MWASLNSCLIMVSVLENLVYFNGNSFSAVASFSSENCIDLFCSQSMFAVLTASSNTSSVHTLSSIDDIRTQAASTLSTIGTSLAIDTTIWVGTTNGVALWQTSDWRFIFPYGPSTNIVTSLVVDDEGVLWGATGPTLDKGFYRYNMSLPDSLQWKIFTSDKYPIMQSSGRPFDSYFKVSLGKKGSVWVSSWGNGILEIRGDSIYRKLDTKSKPPLPTAVASNPDFSLPTGVAVDNEGDVWIANSNVDDNCGLVRLTSDTTAINYYNPFSLKNTFFHNVAIDDNGTVWIGNSETFYKQSIGLYYYNKNSLVSGTAAYNGWGLLNTENGLPSNIVLSVIVDQSDYVWIGMDPGLTIITNPLYPKSSRTSVYPLRQEAIQAIAIDAVDNKWVGTKTGIYVLNSDGTQLLNQYNVANTNGKLIDDDIQTIAIDNKRGLIYFGTGKGISCLSIEPVTTSPTFTSLALGPNPYMIPNAYPLTIRNLVANSTIKILTLTGRLIRQFPAQGGGRAFWDGKDISGNLVPSGIYFVVAFNETGTQVTSAKLAVIRKN